MNYQYQVNQVVEACQYNGHNDEEINDFLEESLSYYRFKALDFKNLHPLPVVTDWVVVTLQHEVLIVPNSLFCKLYTKVNH